MPSFDVRFIKTVCDDTGHEHRACQALFKVDATSLTSAAQQAEANFCQQKGVHDWTIFADAMELRVPPARPSASGGESPERVLDSTVRRYAGLPRTG
jgi:hypothetical protein